LNLILKYPSYSPRLKQQAGSTYIFDFIRKKWLILTPEEWVRQHVLNYLVHEKKYAASTIAVEKELSLNDVKKRFDIVVYSKNLNPFLIIECKAPYIELDNLVVEQALRYNIVIKAPFLMITNGLSDLIFNNQQERIELPVYV